MSLFWKDWLALKEAIKWQLFNHDMNYQRMSFEQAQPYLTHEINKLTVPDLENFIKTHGIKTKETP